MFSNHHSSKGLKEINETPMDIISKEMKKREKKGGGDC